MRPRIRVKVDYAPFIGNLDAFVRNTRFFAYSALYSIGSKYCFAFNYFRIAVLGFLKFNVQETGVI